MADLDATASKTYQRTGSGTERFTKAQKIRSLVVGWKGDADGIFRHTGTPTAGVYGTERFHLCQTIHLST
ncbi:hypothetical protein TNCV_763511 [Trichonephila clavipes]|nr:hypothetical protein TNCV_763511 [Trichonephila clavipes]